MTKLPVVRANNDLGEDWAGPRARCGQEALPVPWFGDNYGDGKGQS